MTDTSKTAGRGAMRAADILLSGRVQLWRDKYAEIIDRETHAGEMVHLLGALTLLIRNMGDVYGVKAAHWLIEKQSFQDAERLLKELES